MNLYLNDQIPDILFSFFKGNLKRGARLQTFQFKHMKKVCQEFDHLDKDSS